MCVAITNYLKGVINMAKVVKFLSPFQLARLLKETRDDDWIWIDQSILEEMIEEKNPVAMFIDAELNKLGYGSWEDEYGTVAFRTPPTRILAQVLNRIMKGKQFIPIDEELVYRIPNPPKKWRWRQVDKCHRRWGFRKEVA